MYIYFRSLVIAILSLTNLGLVRESELASLRVEKIEFDNLRNKIQFYLILPLVELHKRSLTIHNLIKYSKSEKGQDVFALIANNFARDKVFLEIGAYDGITASNTYLLEKEFGWTGLLVECIPSNFSDIKFSRDCCSILAAATKQDAESVEVVRQPAPNLSSLANVVYKRIWKNLSYQVPGYSLDSLLMMACPKGEIGFLSVDIEGAEYSIFEDVDLSEYNISAICVEHNFRPDKEKLQNLITAQGYRVVFEEFSGNDYWFVKI